MSVKHKLFYKQIEPGREHEQFPYWPGYYPINNLAHDIIDDMINSDMPHEVSREIINNSYLDLVWC